MIKICYVLGTLEVGGAERQLHLLLRNLDRSRFEPVMIGLRDGRMRTDFEEIAKVYVVGKRWKIDPVFFIRLASIIRREDPDILHTSMFTSNLWGRMAGRICNVPVIVSSELSMDLWKNPLHFLLDRWMARFTSKIICNSHEVKRRYAKVLQGYRDRLTVVYNGIDTDFYERVEHGVEKKKEMGIQEGERVVLTGGRLCAEKGLEYFISAAAIVAGKFKDIRFLIIGEGDDKAKLLRLRDAEGLNSSVIFTGYRKDLPELIKFSDVVVLSSLFEGLPNLLLEAMILGKPVVASDIGGIKEIVMDKENGFLFPVGAVDKLAERMLCLIQNPLLCRQMGEKGRRFVKEKFSLKSLVEHHQIIYENLAEIN